MSSINVNNIMDFISNGTPETEGNKFVVLEFDPKKGKVVNVASQFDDPVKTNYVLVEAVATANFDDKSAFVLVVPNKRDRNILANLFGQSNDLEDTFEILLKAIIGFYEVKGISLPSNKIINILNDIIGAFFGRDTVHAITYLKPNSLESKLISNMSLNHAKALFTQIIESIDNNMAFEE